MSKFKAIKQWFFKQSHAGLAVSFCDAGVTVVQIDDDGQLVHALSFPFPGAQQSLTHFVRQHGLQKKACVCTLAKKDYQTFLLEKPHVPEAEMLSAIRWRLADSLDYPIDASVMDYIELPSKSASEMVYIVVANKGAISDHLQIVQKAGLKPILVDIPELCQAAMFEKMGDNVRSKAFVRITNHGVNLQIYKKGHLLLMRHIDLEYGKFDEFDKFVHELALQIQRSQDYCSSTIADTSNSIIYVESNINQPQICETLEKILGLSVQPLVHDTFLESGLGNYDMLALMGALLKEHQA